jgi:hypothetical protein
MINNRSIFRQQALEHYQHIQMPKTLPRFTSPLTIFWYWVLFFIFIGSVLSIWSLNVPVYEQGSGGIRNLTASELKTYGLPVSGDSERVTAIMFFPRQSTVTLHNGSSVSILITGVLQPMIGKVEHIDAVTLTPGEARQRYQLGASVPSNLPQTSIVAFIGFSSAVVNGKYDGARATASYQIGTVAVLPLLLKTVSLGGAQKSYE